MNISELKPAETRMQQLGLRKETILKEMSFALQAINKSSQLQKATTESKLNAVINIAQVGLTLNPVSKLAYLVPRYQDGQVQCCLEPSYQGLVKLLTDTGSVLAINVQLVYENDTFEINGASFTEPIKHVPYLSDKRGFIIGAYAIAMLPNKITQYEYMTIDQVNEIRDMSESYKAYSNGKIKSCVWISHDGEMIRKTLLRRIVKYLPKSQKWDKVNDAIKLDETDYQPSENKKRYARELLEASTVVEEMEIYSIEQDIEMSNDDRLSEIIADLRERQRDNGRMSQTEIGAKIKEIGG